MWGQGLAPVLESPTDTAISVDDMTRMVDVMVDVDPANCSISAAEDWFLGYTEAITRLQAGRLAMLAVLDGNGVGNTDHNGSTAGWMRELTQASPAAASRDVHLTRDLVALPELKDAMTSGRISIEHARVIASLRKDLPDEVTRGSLTELIDLAATCDPLELRRAVLLIRDAYSPDKARERERRQYDQRTLSAATTFEGVGVGSWLLPQAQQETVMTAIHAFSSPHADDDRTPGQRRADALVTIAELALASALAPETGGIKPHVTVLIPLDTLEARAGAPAARYGFGASSSGEWARRMCCDAAISRLIADQDGQPLDVGRATRTFNAAQRRAVIARDRECVWPGCDRPAAWCEVHHAWHWADGGPTSVDNALLICGRHHDRIHQHDHAVVIRPDGTRSIDIRPGSAKRPKTCLDPPRGTGPPR